MVQNRRSFLFGSAALVGAAALSTRTPATGAVFEARIPGMHPSAPAAASTMGPSPAGIRPELFASALAALQRHGERVMRDRIAVVDFSAPSSDPRFHIVDIASGSAKSFLVSHGSGSDPDHSGWLERFSNREGSNASSAGAFMTGNYYVGKHGRSQRLHGLDPSNSNALRRAIVVHGARYAEPDFVAAHGKLGRSQGCFAVGRSEIGNVFGRLGAGRLIYAAKLEDAARPGGILPQA